MGQKVNPISFRLVVNKDWRSKWFKDSKSYAKLLRQDIELRKYILENRKNTGIARIDVERIGDKKVNIIVYTAKMGLFIGAKGENKDKLVESIKKDLKETVNIRPIEVKKPQINAQLISENVAMQLKKRVSFRKAMKKAIQEAMKSGAKGVKIFCSGRLGGAEMARTEWYREGRVPLQTLRAKIEYGFSEALTTYGLIGVKTLVYLGDE
ncbi:30S ribosomal protein S3 [bacterium]|nr:30S ribosomal protein S3 [bacterium]